KIRDRHHAQDARRELQPATSRKPPRRGGGVGRDQVARHVGSLAHGRTAVGGGGGVLYPTGGRGSIKRDGQCRQIASTISVKIRTMTITSRNSVRKWPAWSETTP